MKIDNHPDARPQSGLNQADIVYEENVEHLTRFAAVFQTTAPDPVGPIRSGRTQDVELLGSLNQPIFAWSGGNPGVTKAINSSDFIVANVQTNARAASKSFRSRDNAAPHNLYAQGSGLFTLSPEVPAPPPQQFLYRKADAPVEGVASGGVELKMDGVNVSWKFDPKTSKYLRFQGGSAHNDAALGQVNADNVVVLVVDYQASSVDAKSPEAQTTGTGEVFVFSGDKVLHGTWTRGDRLQPYTLTADSGNPIELTPGRTWVELARTDSTTLIPGLTRSGRIVGGGRSTTQAPFSPWVTDRGGGTLETMTSSSSTPRATGTYPVKRGLAEMLKGGVIMDVVTSEQAKIAEDAGATAVMALERVPADIRRDGGVARMSDPEMIEAIKAAVTIPVMAKVRIGHFVEAQILESLGVDYVDESEVLTPADETHHIDKFAFTVPFVCGATNLGEALRRISEGACMIRSKGEAGTGNIVEAVRHLRNIIGDIRKVGQADSAELFQWAKTLQAPLGLVQEIAETGWLPVPLFCAGGIATPADAALAMQLGAEAVFVGSGHLQER